MDSTVWFGCGGWRRDGHRLNVQCAKRLWCRRPRKAARGLITPTVRIATRSSLAHVMLECGGVVMDPRPEHVFFWPARIWHRRFLGLRAYVDVRLAHPSGMERFEGRGRAHLGQTIIHWATRGAAGAPNDCLVAVRSCLRAGGYPVPDWVTAPVHLYHWLARQGAPHGEAR